jgi:hypothetical protein
MKSSEVLKANEVANGVIIIISLPPNYSTSPPYQ